MKTQRIISAVLTILILIGCPTPVTEPTDAELVATAKTALYIGYADEDKIDSVTQDVTLPTTEDTAPGVTITWSSDNTAVITAAGAVTRPASSAGNAAVKLTATISKGGESDTKEFSLTVLKEETTGPTDADAVAAALSALDITAAVGGNLQAVTDDFTLPTAGEEGTSISWEVVSGSAITLSGTNNENAAVTRPGLTATDDDVVIKATVAKNGETDTKTFNLKVLKVSNLSDAESVNQAKNDLEATGLGFAGSDTWDGITQDFTLPVSIGTDGVTISWEVVSGSGIVLSGNSNQDASVSRPDYMGGDSNVKLRATYSKNGATASEEFDLTVLKKDQVPLTTSLTGSISPITIPAGSDSTKTLTFTGASQSLSIGTDIEVRIKTRPNTAAEAHLSMGVNTGVLFPKTNIIPRDGGDYIIELSGIGNYTGTLDRTLNLTVTALAINSISYTAINAETSTALTAAAVPTVDPAEAAAGALFDIDTDFTAETGLSFNTGTGAISGTPSAVIDKSYTVSITGGDATKYEGSTQSTSIQVKVTLSDADAVANALSALDITTTVGGNLQAVTSSFTLPTVGEEGTSISWEVLSGSAITLSGSNNENAAVARPSFTATDDDVVIKATVTKNGETDTKTFNLKVLKASNLSDAESVNQAKDDLEIAGLGFALGDTFDSVTQDFTLPTIGSDGVSISWNVVSGSGISLSGSSNKDASVSRPDHTSGNSDVRLRATYSKNGATASEEFDLTVLKKDQIPLTASLTGSINPISIIAGSDNTKPLTFTGASQSLIIGTDIEVRIKTRPNTAAEAHLSMGVNTGVLFPSTDIIPRDGGDYIIELSGIGNYTGTLDHTLNLTVTALGINSITYTAINAETSTALTAAAVPTVDPTEAATGALFDIDTDFTTETGLSFDTGTGAISGTASAVIDKSYTVSITGGDGTKYEGSTQSTSIQVRVTLSDADAVAAAKAALTTADITFASGEDKDTVTQDITLPATGTGGTTIAWSSNNTAVITAAGAVTRPSASSSDATVTLTATISKGSASDTKTFSLTVLNEEPIDIGTLGSFTIDVDAATAKTNTESSHSVTVNGGLSSGTDYTLSITDPLTITNAGVITIPNTYTSTGTHQITVTATGRDNYTGTKTATFTLTVVLSDADAVAAATAALTTADITFASGEDASKVIQDITLPAAGTDGTSITWSSNNGAIAVAGTAGTVARPANGASNAAVTLTATITKDAATGTKTFALTVIKMQRDDMFSYVDAPNGAVTINNALSTNSVTVTEGTYSNIKSEWADFLDPKLEQASLAESAAMQGGISIEGGGDWNIDNDTIGEGTLLSYTFSRPVIVRSLLIAPRRTLDFAVRLERISIVLYDNTGNVLVRFDNPSLDPDSQIPVKPDGTTWTVIGDKTTDNYGGHHQHTLSNPIGGVYGLKLLINTDDPDNLLYTQFNYFNAELEF